MTPTATWISFREGHADCGHGGTAVIVVQAGIPACRAGALEGLLLDAQVAFADVLGQLVDLVAVFLRLRVGLVPEVLDRLPVPAGAGLGLRKDA